MKNIELFDKHVDRRKAPKKKQRTFEKEDTATSRAARVSFKNYIRELEESLLDDDLDETTDEL